MKKLLCMLLCLLLAMAVLAGCTGPGNGSDDPTEGEIIVSDEGVHYDADGNLVVPKHEGVSLTIGIPESVYVQDYEENYYTKWLEEKTGIDITIKKYASTSADYKRQLATETASQTEKLPDILFGFSLGSDLIDQYGEDGYLVDLTPYVNNKSRSAIFWDKLESLRTDPNGDWDAFADRILLQMKSDEAAENGETVYYGLPDAATSLVDYLDFYPWINTKWLDVVKKDKPTNLQELKEVLIAFKNTDCNGNNIKDEIPMLGSKTGEMGADVVAWLTNFFVYYNDAYPFNIDDEGKLYLPYTTEAYRDAMDFISDLVAEGLLNPKSLTSVVGTTQNMLTNGDFVGVTLGHPTLVFQTNYRYDDYAVLDLYGNVYYNPEDSAVKMFITEDCADVGAAYDLLMLVYTWESAVIQRYGEKGVDWDEPAEGTMTAIGLPATVKTYNDLWAKPQAKHWGALVSFNTYETFDLIDTSEHPMNHKKWQKFKEGTDAYKIAYEETIQRIGKEHISPWLRFNREENEMAPARESLKKEVEAWRSKFILGEKDAKNEADWAEYLAVLDKAGIQAYIDAATVCYNRMYPNGHVSN